MPLCLQAVLNLLDTGLNGSLLGESPSLQDATSNQIRRKMLFASQAEQRLCLFQNGLGFTSQLMDQRHTITRECQCKRMLKGQG